MSLVEHFERAILHALSPSGRRARLLILTYHRVLAAPDPLLEDEPDAAQFSEQVDVLRRYCRVLPLPEAIERLQSDTLPPCAACITFDDGYANNLAVALPILEQRGLTATVFIAVDAIRRGVMWNDLVIESVRAARSTIDLSPLGQPPLEFADAARAAVIADLLGRMKYLPLARRWQLALELFSKNARGDHPRLMLSDAEVAAMAARGHDVGAHTIHHPILRELPADEARAEIVESGRWLAEVTGKAPRSFAYPNGRPNRDYDRTHVEMVRAAGFDLAVSTSWGCATRRSDRYQLPRCTPWELSARGFAARLAKNYLMHAD
jgi:peptidoglycan/xylan/chitin deacetylase (PgdA/CDA1 family)